MKVYIVKPGDSLWTIARSFKVTPKSIMETNDIQESTPLVVGQTLVIPGNEITYRVREGDTIWSIARKFDSSVNSIANANNLSSPYNIYPGLILKIPEMSKNYGNLEVNAFIQPSNAEQERQALEPAINYLTYIAPFSYHVKADGSLTPINDENILAISKEKNVLPMLSVTNISEENFDTDLIKGILDNPTVQQTLINNILQIIKQKGYGGTIIDFERIPPSHREKYNNFLRTVVDRLHPNYLVATALAPKTYDITEGSWHGAHDYKAHGSIVDFVIIMTYEWGWSGGPPMAVAPINEVIKVINYAVSVIPPKKIMMGIPFYGYDWTLPYVPKGEFAKAIGNEEAIDIARKYGAIIKYDIKSQSPYYNYIDENRNEHIVWFEDGRSIVAKLKLAHEYGLRGISYWALGKPFPQNWAILDDMFMIKKYK